MIRGAVGENFRGSQKSRSEEVRMDKESVEANNDMPRAQPFVGPGKFPCGRLNIHQIPVEDNVLYPFSSLIPYWRTSFLLFNGQGDVEITCYDDISGIVQA